MKVPSRDVGRTEKSAVDPNEMQSLVEKFETNRRMPNPHRATNPVSERESVEQGNIRVLGIEGVDAAHLAANMPPLHKGPLRFQPRGSCSMSG
jgi:hypothetical protein